MSTDQISKLQSETVAPVAPVVLQANKADTVPAPGKATNEDTRADNEAMKQAGALDRKLGATVEVAGASIEALVAIIIEIDTVGIVHETKTAWEVLGNTSLKSYVAEALGNKLKSWDKAGRDALLNILVARGFSLTDAAAMTGTSKATATRTVQRATAAKAKAEGKDGATAAPKEPSTPLTRISKSADKLADNVSNVDDYPSADVTRAALDMLRSVDKMVDELFRRGHKADATKLVTALQACGQKARAGAEVAPRSGAQGTTGNGVNAKPSAK